MVKYAQGTKPWEQAEERVIRLTLKEWKRRGAEDMERLEALERELKELRERLRREERAGAQRADLAGQREEVRARKRALASALSKEERDVEALEGMSFQAVVQTVLGRREEQLEEERREAVAARMRYQDACRALEDVEDRLRRAEEVLRQAGADRARCEALLEEKRGLLKAADPALGARIVALEERAAGRRALLKEIGEAQAAGRAVSAALDRALNSLDSAEGWGAWDMLGGGLIATAAKHGRIDEARNAAEDARRMLSRFRTELADVRVCARLDIEVGEFATFCDYFFDGLLADWAVQNSIHRAQSGVEDTARQVDEVMGRLDRMEEQTRGELDAAERELRAVAEGT